ncbi:hypothetical protein E1176_03925 [Fulvivirga sp. RKSG066]|uniref:hypothetical protein n=1 Tax=Fulvivirga aurantia TaxID=2529383 RepID=UPI0012BBCC1E|nr:hypothetical protein [Fulvivirga aurantia]MTI20158.1 hypothetical protein [Fulvivirga aurantia]
MGYMGFGMKKEVFTRKPKEALKKIKETYGNDIVRAKTYKIESASKQTLLTIRQKIADQKESALIRSILIFSASCFLGVLLAAYWSDLIKWWFMQ